MKTNKKSSLSNKKNKAATSEQLIDELNQAKQREARALADYQNLVRRTNEERSKMARFATVDFITHLIQPLSHLSLAGKQLNDVGLNMVIDQLWQVLEANGVKKIDCIDKEFNLDTMEAVEKGDKGQKVIEVVQDGYLLNNEVIQHAKVILD